jgi:uptake hydrogenase large subunit
MQQVNGLMAAVQRVHHALDPERLACRAPGVAPADVGNAWHAAWDALRDDAGEAVFGEPAALWLARDAADTEGWLSREDTPATRLLRFVRRRDWGGIGTSDAPPLQIFEPATLRQRLDADTVDRYLADPTGIDGQHETGTTVRQLDHPLVAAASDSYGRGLYTRLLARLVELGRLLTDPTSLSQTASADGADGDGLAQLEAARGRLCHRVLVDDHRVVRYQILAPTEWNFGGRGPAVDGLAALLDGDGPVVQAQAEMLIHAIDPCVGFDLRIGTG